MKKAYLSLLLFAMTITSHAQHFITDAAYRQKTETAFQQKMKLIGAQFYNIKGLKVTPEEQEALRFLYAYMPVADATDYPTAYHLNNVHRLADPTRDGVGKTSARTAFPPLRSAHACQQRTARRFACLVL